MILPSDKEYTQTKRIMLGTEKMKPEFVSLAEWIDKIFAVKTINIIYDHESGTRPCIQVCFEFEREMKLFLKDDSGNFDEKKQHLIARKFKELMEQQGLVKRSVGLSEPEGKEGYETEDVFVIFAAFEPVARLEASYKLTEEAMEEYRKALHNEDIWTVSIGFTSPTIFLYTDEKVKQYDHASFKKLCADTYFEIIRKFDEFNYFKREDIQVYLDSKENFDNNYQSNWYYYYK